MWAVGTALGISMGNILPARIVSALSVALFGMFLAVIIPPSRKDKAVGAAVLASFVCSLAAGKLPLISDLSHGNRTIILTVLISAVFAALFPRRENEAEEEILEEAEKYSSAEGGDTDE
jgi:predicted branched-subunit amino acid permease